MRRATVIFSLFSLGALPPLMAQEAVRIVYPPDGASVREVVTLKVEKPNPEQGYVTLQIGGEFVAAIAADRETGLFLYRWDTKKFEDGEHEIEVVAIGAGGEIEGRTKIRVKVENGLSPPEALEGLRLRESFRTGDRNIYILKVEADFDTPWRPEARFQVEQLSGKVLMRILRWVLYPLPDGERAKVRDSILTVRSTLRPLGVAVERTRTGPTGMPGTMMPGMVGPMGPMGMMEAPGGRRELQGEQVGPSMPGTMGPMGPGGEMMPGMTSGAPAAQATPLFEGIEGKKYTFLVSRKGGRKLYRPRRGLDEYPYGGVYLLLPEEPVRAGDEWESEMTMAIPFLGDIKKITVKHVLAGFEWQAGRRCVKIVSTFEGLSLRLPLPQAGRAGAPGMTGPGAMPGAAPPEGAATGMPSGMPGMMMPEMMGLTGPMAGSMPPGMGGEMGGMPGPMDAAAGQIKETEVEVEGKRITYFDYAEGKVVGYIEELEARGRVPLQVQTAAQAGATMPGGQPGVPGIPGMMIPGMMGPMPMGPMGPMGPGMMMPGGGGGIQGLQGEAGQQPIIPGMPIMPGMMGPMGPMPPGMGGMPRMVTQVEEVEVVCKIRTEFMIERSEE